MKKYRFLLIVFIVLFGVPKGNAQEIAASDPEMARIQIANALRAGNIELALKGFANSEKSQTIIRALNAAQRNSLAAWIEKAEPIYTSKNGRVYRGKWVDPQGNIRSKEFIFVRDRQGHWRIISW